jgi:hypothetical protein
MSMGEMSTLIGGSPGSRRVGDATTVPLLRRVVESLSTMHPGRYTVYLGRPDPVAVRTDWEQEATLMRSARRAVVATPATTPLPQEADRRDPGFGWLAETWFSAVVSENTAMALVCQPDFDRPEEAWLLTEVDAVRRLIGAVEGELARPDPQLLAV